MGELLNRQESLKSSSIINKWENIGFLTNVKNKRNVSLACEIASLYLLNETEDVKYSEDTIEILAHPVVARIFRNIEEDLPFNLIVDKTIQIIIEFSEQHKIFESKFGDLQSKENLVNEIEAKLVYEFCSNFKINFGKIC